jgi:putative salt-induced outer membrane protein YdiY
MDDISTFATDAPVELAMTNGTTVVGQLKADAEGQVMVQAEGAARPEGIALAGVAKINPEKVRWTGSIVGGAVFSRGNTASDTSHFSADAVRRSERDRITLGAGYRYANQRDLGAGISTTTEENWFLKGQYDYFVSKKCYTYGNLKYEKDRIARIDQRITAGLGVGYQWIEAADLSFFTEAGLSWVFERYPEPDLAPAFPTGDGSWLIARLTATSNESDYIAARLAYRLGVTLNSRVKAFHNVEFLPSLEDLAIYLINADVGARLSLTERIFTEAKIRMAYNAKPNDDREKRDMRYSFGVGLAF